MSFTPRDPYASPPVDLGIAEIGEARLIAKGGMSTVYKAKQLGLDRDVAVKVLGRQLGEGDRERFDGERRAMATLAQHPNVVTVYMSGIAPHSQLPYIVMELIEGGSLLAHIDRYGPLGWQQAIHMASLIAGALAAAHDVGIHHRDIKPSNILLSKEGPKLSDFGIARFNNSGAVRTETLFFSPDHSPPEAFHNVRDQRSDLYSLASTLYQAIAGEPPFPSGVAPVGESLVPRHWRQDPPPLDERVAPAALNQFFKRALASDPDHRPQSAAEFIEELSAVGGVELNDSATSAFQPPDTSQPPIGHINTESQELMEGFAKSRHPETRLLSAQNSNDPQTLIDLAQDEDADARRTALARVNDWEGLKAVLAGERDPRRRFDQAKRLSELCDIDFLVDDPDPSIREMVAKVTDSYKIRARLIEDSTAPVRDAAFAEITDVEVLTFFASSDRNQPVATSAFLRLQQIVSPDELAGGTEPIRRQVARWGHGNEILLRLSRDESSPVRQEVFLRSETVTGIPGLIDEYFSLDERLALARETSNRTLIDVLARDRSPEVRRVVAETHREVVANLELELNNEEKRVLETSVFLGGVLFVAAVLLILLGSIAGPLGWRSTVWALVIAVVVAIGAAIALIVTGQERARTDLWSGRIRSNARISSSQATEVLP